MKTIYPLYLASQSPRRREILENAGFTFNLLYPKNEESYPENLGVFEVPEFLAQEKLAQVRKKNNNTLIICADTVVVFDDKILNKPRDYEEAKWMLNSLKNRWHTVITGVAIAGPDFFVSFSDYTEVLFNDINKIEIDYYLEKFKPYDKAGAYGIQEFLGMNKVSKINGSFYNVMGLPIHRVYENLENFIVFD